MTADDTGPVLVMGVCRRSGTNYLARLLATHPDAGRPRDPVREDHLFRDARRLVRYTRAVARRWPRRWGDREAARTVLLHHLGAGLGGFLQELAGPVRVVTKTPDTHNLALAATLVPDAHLVVLLRDGRSVTESLVRGFGFTRERALREWRRGAARVTDFLASPAAERDNVTVVRFESLVTDPEGELPRLLTRLGLDPSRVDPGAVRDLPVTGSSFLRSADDEITWTPQRRPSGFDPARRHADWGHARRERFAWVAGAQQRALGYPCEARGGPLWAVANTALDLVSPLVLALDWLRVAYRRARAVVRGDDGSATQSSSP